MLTLRDFCIHSYFRDLNIFQAQNNVHVKKKLIEFCSKVGIECIPKNLFFQIIHHDVNLLENNLGDHYTLSYLGGSGVLDLRFLKTFNSSYFTKEKILKLLNVVYGQFESNFMSTQQNTMNPLKVLRFPKIDYSFSLKDIFLKIISDYPQLELLEIPVKNISTLRHLVEIVIRTNLERLEKSRSEKIYLPFLSIRTSIFLFGDEVNSLNKILKSLVDSNISPKNFQIEIDLEHFNLAQVEGDYSPFLSLKEISNSPFVEKLISDTDGPLLAIGPSILEERSSRIYFEYPKSFVEDSNVSSYFSPEPLVDFFKMSYLSSVNIAACPDFTQSDLDKILLLQIEHLDLRNQNDIKAIRSNTLMSLTCNDCFSLELIQTSYIEGLVILQHCPELTQFIAPKCTALIVEDCQGVTELSLPSVVKARILNCHSLTIIDFPGADYCNLSGCHDLRKVSMGAVRDFQGNHLASLENLHLPQANKVDLFNLPALKTLDVPSGLTLRFDGCDALERLNAPLYKGIEANIRLGRHIKRINLPQFRGTLSFTNSPLVTFFNAPYVDQTTLPYTVRYPYPRVLRQAAIHLVAIAILGVLGLLLSHLMRAQNDPQE